MVSVRFDKEANALYFKLRVNAKVEKTISLGKDRFMDVDKSGKTIGFEILFPKEIPQEAIRAISKSKSVIEILQ